MTALALLLVAAGILIAYAGITGDPILQTLRGVVGGPK